jgi:hypothetical protein
MKPLNMKLALSAVAIVMLATPALAARHHETQRLDYSNNATVQSGQAGTYPNGAAKTGSAASVESGAVFNLQKRATD